LSFRIGRCMRCERGSGTAVQRMDLRRRSARVRSAWRWWLHLARSRRAMVAAAEWMARAKRVSKVGWAMRAWRQWSVHALAIDFTHVLVYIHVSLDCRLFVM
jgi:hypothetical protein